MIDNLHHIHRKFTTGVIRTVLRHNPHLLAVSYFLRESRDGDIEVPAFRLVYGVVSREVDTSQSPASCNAQDRANSDAEVV